MVKVETRIQLAIKEILEEETWKHLKTNNNFDKVLSIASLIEPFDEGPMYVMKIVEVCVLVVTMATNILLIGEQVIIFEIKPFSLITDHELDMLIDAIDDKVHTCDEWCSILFAISMKLQVVRLGTVKSVS